MADVAPAHQPQAESRGENHPPAASVAERTATENMTEEENENGKSKSPVSLSKRAPTFTFRESLSVLGTGTNLDGSRVEQKLRKNACVRHPIKEITATVSLHESTWRLRGINSILSLKKVAAFRVYEVRVWQTERLVGP